MHAGRFVVYRAGELRLVVEAAAALFGVAEGIVVISFRLYVKEANNLKSYISIYLSLSSPISIYCLSISNIYGISYKMVSSCSKSSSLLFS